MPVTRFGNVGDEKSKGIAQPQVMLVNALKTNRAISDVIMTEVTKRYGNVDLNEKLVNPKAFHVSFSWG